ncbi:MAG TPA: hypothetical protein VGV87_27935 [Blastocatellia bacterium]|nr:hypothetical protein [Blastocatellia bacterium]
MTPDRKARFDKSMRPILTFILLVSALAFGCNTPGLSQSKSETLYKPKAGSNQIDSAIAESYLERFRGLSDQDLSSQPNEEDFNQRAAAARVRLERAGIPVSSAGVDRVESRYLTNEDSKGRAYGFWLLGELALQGVANERITDVILRFVERHPTDPVCDNALWALGEVGSEDALEHFYEIAADTERYGPVARERSFCCISQCGRYSGATRFENIPRILDLGKKVRDPQTQQWCIMALQYMAPGVGLSSIPEWEKWWQAQVKLRGGTK